MPITRRRLVAGAAGLAAAAPAILRRAKAASQISFSYQQSSAVLITLKQQGTLEHKLADKGFGVAWSQFKRIQDAMITNVVDFHSDVADAVPVFAQASGAPLTYYARESPSPHAEAIIVPAESPITTVAALKGKRIGVSKGSGAHYLVLAALKRAGLHASDVQLAFLDAGDGLPAFGRGDIDAWSIWDPYLAITESRLPTRRVEDGAGGNSDYNRFYMVSTSFAAAHPDIVQLVYTELVAAGAWLRSNPVKGAELLAPLWGGTPVAVIETVNKRRSYLVGPVTPDALVQQQLIADAFFEASLVKQHLDASAIPVWHPA